ncbi:MliC family protein [Entomobacter blattae]|uniref:Uncharacterized protein n=1 Tax=Entomobacter blattae TaxID=2762277 RepID=A0A7H1NUQ1_9PROT|nr:MliC family protein [Entomobacter blattae]QNT79511.1 hypothetical protein JGUZn3_23100 [Entomobacter blattae]
MCKKKTVFFPFAVGIAIMIGVFSAHAMTDLEIGMVGHPQLVQKMYKYKCEGKNLDADESLPQEVFKVNYVRVADNSLAVLPIKNQNRIFTTVTAPKGKKYVSGDFVWWQQPDKKTVLFQGVTEDGKIVAVCRQVDN